MSAHAPPSRLVLLGHPVAHSRSAVFQNAALEYAGFPQRYESLDVLPSELDRTLEALRAEGAGGNVTIPYKESVAARARCTTLAARVGAVNTFWHEQGVLCGENTDVAGISASIVALCPGGLGETRCAVMGAGGSAAAALVALHQLGCRDVVVAARTPERARRLSARVQVPVRIVATADEAVDQARLVINATPIGMLDDAMPVSPIALHTHAVVIDLVYRPEATAWVRSCRTSGHAAEDGSRILLEQGAAAFECWFGGSAPRHVMWQALGLSAGAGE